MLFGSGLFKSSPPETTSRDAVIMLWLWWRTCRAFGLMAQSRQWWKLLVDCFCQPPPQQLKGHATTLCGSFLSLAQWSTRIWTVVKKSIDQCKKTLTNNGNSCNGLYKNVCRVSGMRAAELTNIGAKFFFKINDCGPTKGSVTLEWLSYRYAPILYDQWPKHPNTTIPFTSSNPPCNSLGVVGSGTSPHLSPAGSVNVTSRGSAQEIYFRNMQLFYIHPS